MFPVRHSLPESLKIRISIDLLEEFQALSRLERFPVHSANLGAVQGRCFSEKCGVHDGRYVRVRCVATAGW